jgi:hypothetical protein
MSSSSSTDSVDSPDTVSAEGELERQIRAAATE